MSREETAGEVKGDRKEEEKDVEEDPVISISSNIVFYGKLDGEVLYYKFEDHTNVTSVHKEEELGETSCVYISTFQTVGQINNVHVKIGTAVYDIGHPETESNFDAFFTVGSRPYSNNAVNGAYFAVRDKVGTEWSSNGDQTGSTFTVDAINPVELGGYHNQKVKITLNCKLYAGSQTKNLSNASLVCYFRKL